ncbi:MAG: ImmA/IrrE family metallo-endopeptidase [Nitrospirae bacterium]|nr:MAG: ImmA/IrrE family metallo-endopeptidase [Nitrospirota bacterium]
MSRSAYYEQMKSLAREVRKHHGLTTPRVSKSDIRTIYRGYGIRIDLWPYSLKNLRGAYFNDDLGPTVMIARDLPLDPYIFTMAHELKHHLADSGKTIPSYCDPSNESDPVEIGAEVFAAELIFPENDFEAWLLEAHVAKSNCTPDILIKMKRETRTTLSYTGLGKRAERLGYAQAGSLSGVRWKKLEEQIYGEPEYKRIQRYRQACLKSRS